ncbi:hypothetical protein [Lactiplantibacillus plantarum]|uniref:hypothetical protein n=1 Tax=Lactiplantibacillus plantarum TaxID=1590 RepID=UPI000B3ED818|nr:hypothetical protein [Lactiplantibacillus plantarum]ARW15105.1 hypothetical protein S100434_02998 [Lactiplantibacillus plantarum subsp. plantarum]MYU98141.1 hypothetical protein [Lactiplantibacillus plantarum]QHM21833.1 hypothetical protein C7M31_01306 [Lactiplantibacillus plantarum]QHM25230.1 hypothetical protein C7M32_01751 [Lactiplantibacillus plantarum]QHM27746.1 hypothetical protein C7M33_01305 [Lactiplantibacillus plantarum]
MTNYPELKVLIHGREVRWEEINHWKAIRASRVLQELVDLHQHLYLNGKVLSENQFYQLTDDELVQAAMESKLVLSDEMILKLYADRLKKSDAMWHEFIAKTPKDAPLKESHVILEVTGLSPTLLQGIDHEGAVNRQQAFALHPEHYVFTQTGSVQTVMETFGGYQNPSLFHLYMLDPQKEALPIALDPSTKAVIFGKGTLASDELDIQQYALHQIQPRQNGFRLDLGIFAPAGVADEAIVGHMEHFAIEFGSMIKLAIDHKRQQ